MNNILTKMLIINLFYRKGFLGAFHYDSKIGTLISGTIIFQKIPLFKATI